ncbi:hypothetical protein LHP98_10235 [Rhodobacter sp. Har01]|uniref:hypothetical protein n=1 Tax=Rhodobacter sp. Har01 TaxID=2883999 RepID=UPI001D075218|nr:hypothetical protein [Rhodobacter sp. Har01]MCB6178509.1 hypothetical protein [Rhodobacter sp. Har01]
MLWKLTRILLPAALLPLAACDPQEMADKTVRRAAYDVVFPVVNRDMPAGLAAAATDCILNAASMPEVRMLARDVGVEAGTQTKENIRNLALTPSAQACFAAAGVPPLKA